MGQGQNLWAALARRHHTQLENREAYPRGAGIVTAARPFMEIDNVCSWAESQCQARVHCEGPFGDRPERRGLASKASSSACPPAPRNPGNLRSLGHRRQLAIRRAGAEESSWTTPPSSYWRWSPSWSSEAPSSSCNGAIRNRCARVTVRNISQRSIRQAVAAKRRPSYAIAKSAWTRLICTHCRPARRRSSRSAGGKCRPGSLTIRARRSDRRTSCSPR